MMGFVEEKVVLRRHWRISFIDDTTWLNKIVELSVGAMELLKYLILHQLSPPDFAFRNVG